MTDKERKDRVICFTTTNSQFEALQTLGPGRDSRSSLLREIIAEYIAKNIKPAIQRTPKH